MHRDTACFDADASVPLRPEALKALTHAASEPGNPASLHAYGQRARRRLEEARQSILKTLNAPRARLVFAGSGSEANALGLVGVAQWQKKHMGASRVLISGIEDDTCERAADQLRGQGFEVVTVRVSPQGTLDVGRLQSLLSREVGAVCLALADASTGIIQPVAEVTRLCRQHAIPVVCDGTQGVGRMAVDCDSLGVATLAFSGHRFGGPRGVGGLVIAAGMELEPLWQGGGQEFGLRSGTPAVPLAAGMAAALEQTSSVEWQRVAELRERLAAGLRRIPGAVELHRTAPKLPHILVLGFLGYPAPSMALQLSARGVYVSAQLADRTLHGMGIAADTASVLLRWSLGYQSKQEDVERAVGVVEEIIRQPPGALP